MADAMDFSPLWGEWHLKELLGRGSFGAVYRAEKTEYGNTYTSAIKHLSIPPQNMTKEMLVADGIATDDKTLSLYCDSLRDSIIKEINFCYTLRGNTNIVAYEDHCIIPKKSGIGYDIFIRMELLTALPKYLTQHNMTEQEVIKLGIELCEALNILNANHIIHRDIKPANIFVNSMGIFKLGDFGESKVLSNSSMGMSIRGTYAYISPEISKGEGGNITADIYSLGLVMYRLLNGNRAPFLPVSGQPVSSAESEQANIRRLKGEPVPAPAYCSNPALASIILKACQFGRENRWQDPNDMKMALESLRYSNNVQLQKNAFGTYQTSGTMPVNNSMMSGIQMAAGTPVSYTATGINGTAGYYPSAPQPVPPPAPKKSRLPLIIGIIAAAVAAVGVTVAIILIANSGKNNNGSNDQSSISSVPGTESLPGESSQPGTSQTETINIREYFETPTGKADKELSEKLGAETDGIKSLSLYTENDDTMVYDFVFDAVGVTDEQKQTMVANMDEQKASMQTLIRTMMTNYGIDRFDILYRYRTSNNNLILEYRISL